jgi:methylenetetrahydrofolate dehydrogenase (NADP+)/methenyltetrahydrofolate cyclohydrolase
MAQARIIDGKTIAAEVIARVTAETAAFKAAAGIAPGLAVVLVGTDPASQVYVANKSRMAEACGFASFQHTLPAETAQHELLELIGRLDRDPAVHGILVQLPLPKPLDADAVIGAISPAKDVDGLHEVNAGRVALGVLDRAFVPCTPAGAMVLIRSVLPDLSGKHAVVIGRSTLVGKPIASLLLGAHCTVTIAHSRTRDLPGLCRQAELLVAAVGRPEMVKGDWIKPGAVVIDVGINRVPAQAAGKTTLVGDVAFAEALDVAGALTPVPGGVGPMTIALLMHNTLLAAKRARGGG